MRTMKFKNVYINNYYSLLGKDEYNPIIYKNVDKVLDTYDRKNKSYEISESIYQDICLNGLLKKINKKSNDIELLIGGDLQNQILASNFNARNYNIPFLGVFSACASFVEGLIIASSFVDSNKIKNAVVISSSHNLVNEKQFRYPVEYGYLRKKVNSFSATGSVSVIVSQEKSKIKIESATIGKVTDMGHKDANDMGSAMAPSCAEVIYEHLVSTNRKPDYYDIIITGDLGAYGLGIMKEYLQFKYKVSLENVIDAGTVLFSEYSGKIFAGGSGPICLPLILFNKIIKKKYKKILIVGTGSLHSLMSVNLKESMPAVSHLISLEVENVY